MEAVRMDDGGRTMRLGDIVTAEMRLGGGEKQKTDLPTPALVLAGHKAKHTQQGDDRNKQRRQKTRPKHGDKRRGVLKTSKNAKKRQKASECA